MTTPNALITVEQFREVLPEFQDSSVFLDEMIQPWLDLAVTMLSLNRWGTMFNFGVSLFAGHQLALQRRALIEMQRGGVPGSSFGAINSKSVNGVSIGYDTTLAGLKDAGDWNLTTYGLRFLQFARMVGSGGIQIVGIDAERISETMLLNGTGIVPNV